jgi:fluoroquinolone transport system permease protein
MKAILSAFRQFLKSIWGDYMLAACLFAPILMGIVFKIGIPLLEKFLCGYFEKSAILELYYVLFDLLLSLMTPLMLCFSGAMVILEELDDGTAKYLLVTPLGKTGYLFSRTGAITVVSLIYNVIVMFIFSISNITWYNIIISAILNAVISIIVAMLVISFAKNKVEGMALIKLSGFMILGFIAAFFIKSPIGYIAGILPSFWIGKLVTDNNMMCILPNIAVSFIWIILLYDKFSNKILR